MPVPHGVGQPCQYEHADALSPSGSVRRGGEGPASTVLGEPALAAELGERGRIRQHGDATGQREGALAVAQGLRRQVQGDQGRGARGVHGDGGTLKAQGVGDASGDDAVRGTGQVVAGQLVGGGAQRGLVAGRGDTGEHPGRGSAQRHRVDARVLHRLPRDFQQQSLLRVHGHRLARGDAEEPGVEARRVLDEPALVGAGSAGLVERVDVPAPVGGEATDGVPPGGHEFPQRVGVGDAARVAAAHADDRDGLPGG